MYRNGTIIQEESIISQNAILKYLTKGTVVIYYKGRMKDSSFASKRMTRHPHYFGIAEIGKVKQDNDSEKKAICENLL